MIEVTTDLNLGLSHDLPVTHQRRSRELESLNNEMWHIKSKKGMIFVVSFYEDLMTINVKIANRLYYFLIQDTPWC